MAGIAELAVPDDRRFDPQSPCRGDLEDGLTRVFWKDEAGAIGLQIEHGDGAILALADEYPLTNLGISRADDGLLLANMVREMSKRYPGKVAFDEFHLGFPESDVSPVAIVKLMLRGPWRWAAVQTALVGGARPVRPSRAVRQPAETSFASPAASTVSSPRPPDDYSRRERLPPLPPRLSTAIIASGSAALAVDRTVEDRQLCEMIQRRAGPAVAAELRQAQAALRGSLGRQKLLAVTQKLHHVAEALDHGT